MADDLYRIDLQRTPAAQLFAAVEEFTCIKSPPDQRPREGYLLDFKQDWSDSALHTMAGFANTFGGLLILGVSDNKEGVPEDIVGITSVGELKTRIGSLISTNLLPCPSFEIGECGLPTDPAKKVCVVRVKESAELCFVTKKGERPVRVRVEDQSPP
jgi:predicted HTH transcriptional regulator